VKRISGIFHFGRSLVGGGGGGVAEIKVALRCVYHTYLIKTTRIFPEGGWRLHEMLMF
jgi:hypothetical protein